MFVPLKPISAYDRCAVPFSYLGSWILGHIRRRFTGDALHSRVRVGAFIGLVLAVVTGTVDGVSTGSLSQGALAFVVDGLAWFVIVILLGRTSLIYQADYWLVELWTKWRKPPASERTHTQPDTRRQSKGRRTRR